MYPLSVTKTFFGFRGSTCGELMYRFGNPVAGTMCQPSGLLFFAGLSPPTQDAAQGAGSGGRGPGSSQTRSTRSATESYTRVGR